MLSSYVPDSNLECEPGWETFENSCYKFVDESKDWISAENDCVDSGAHLASIHSDGEVQFMSSHFTKTSWIGLEWTGNTYNWSDGSGLGFENWNSGEPNNPGTENCTRANHAPGQEHHNKWTDVRCSNTYSYICKKTFIGK